MKPSCFWHCWRNWLICSTEIMISRMAWNARKTVRWLRTILFLKTRSTQTCNWLKTQPIQPIAFDEYWKNKPNDYMVKSPLITGKKWWFKLSYSSCTDINLLLCNVPLDRRIPSTLARLVIASYWSFTQKRSIGSSRKQASKQASKQTNRQTKRRNLIYFKLRFGELFFCLNSSYKTK